MARSTASLAVMEDNSPDRNLKPGVRQPWPIRLGGAFWPDFFGGIASGRCRIHEGYFASFPFSPPNKSNSPIQLNLSGQFLEKALMSALIWR